MYIFEAVYTNLKTGETIVRTIDFTLAPSLNYREAFEFALKDAFDMQDNGEELDEVKNVSR